MTSPPTILDNLTHDDLQLYTYLPVTEEQWACSEVDSEPTVFGTPLHAIFSASQEITCDVAYIETLQLESCVSEHELKRSPESEATAQKSMVRDAWGIREGVCVEKEGMNARNIGKREVLYEQSISVWMIEKLGFTNWQTCSL